MTTRSSSELWLIGQPITHLSHSKLPSKKEVLCLLMNYKNDKQEKQAFNLTISDVFDQWKKAGIPTSQKCNAVKKLKALYKEWKQLRKSKSKKSFHAREKEKK